jgi:hypothetical protein
MMGKEFASVEREESMIKPLRRSLGLQGKLTLVILPTLIILGVLFFVNILNAQRLLFASLSASAFLIYLDPEHGTNRMQTLIISQMSAALLGLVTYLLPVRFTCRQDWPWWRRFYL